MPKRTSDAEDQINTARQMPANWKSGTGADTGIDRVPHPQQVRDAEAPTEGHPGAPSKLPGYGR